MGSYQTFRGNPENKLFYILNNFTGGINTEFTDDASSDVDFENIINFDVDKLGTLNKRNGFGEISGLTDFFKSWTEFVSGLMPVVYNRTDANINPELNNDNIVYVKLLRNDNNIFRNLAGFNSMNDYQDKYGFQNNSFELLIITTKNVSETSSKSTAWYVKGTIPPVEYDGDGNRRTVCSIMNDSVDLPVTFDWDNTIGNIDTVEYFNDIWFTSNNKALVKFDRKLNGFSVGDDEHFLDDAFQYIGNVEGKDNKAYKPSILEVAEIGANLLCTNPLLDISVVSGITDSIQGVFFTTDDNKLITDFVLPVSEPVYMHVFYTGGGTFEISAKSGDVDIPIETSVVGNMSTNTKTVYSLKFKNAPTGEVEITIKKTDSSVVEPYIVFYKVGQLNPKFEPIQTLNVGDCGMCFMSDNRVVYYKEDTLYFSDVNRFNYIPANNYLKLPLEPTDKITKVCYFKGVYVVFTKNSIYKIIGTWGSSDFACEPINTSLGCHAGNTVVPIEDTLYFMSPRGLFALKSSTFVEGMQNLKELDLKVKKLTTDFTVYDSQFKNLTFRYNGVSENAYAIRYKDKYILFYNNYGDTGDYAAVNNIDALVYQYEAGIFTTYRFSEKPTFYFMLDGNLETLATTKDEEGLEYLSMFEFGISTTDFGKPIYVEFQTKATNMRYPQHLKKLKNTFVKMIGGYSYDEFFFELYADGYLVNNPKKYSVSLDEEGSVVYDYTVEKILKVDEIKAVFGLFRLGATKLGEGTYQVKKLIIPSKSKNFSCKVYGESSDYLSFESIGFVCKLGKVKEG